MNVFIMFNDKLSSYDFVTSIFSKYYGIDLDHAHYRKTDNGKPYFTDCRYHYNVSHCAGLIAGAISDSPVGIDVEKISKIRPRLVDRYFSAQEKECIYNNPSSANSLFSLIWTRREAFVKWEGGCIETLDDTFSSLSVSHIKTYYFGNYYISICSENFENIRFIFCELMIDNEVMPDKANNSELFQND